LNYADIQSALSKKTFWRFALNWAKRQEYCDSLGTSAIQNILFLGDFITSIYAILGKLRGKNKK
jgi:hypothetical protein